MSTGINRGALSSGVRLRTVDALRAVAALMVLLHHLPIGGTGPLFAALRAVSAIGLSGVGLFLVISGFSIHLRWAMRPGAPFELKRFWVRRFWRLYPTFYVAALLTAVLTWLAGKWHSWSTPLVVAPGSMPGWATVLAELTVVTATVVPLKWIDVSWSIALEEHLYAAYSLIMRKARRVRPLLALWVAFAVSIVWRVGAELFTTSVPQGQFVNGNFSALSRLLYIQAPSRCFEWVLGLVLAEAWVGNVRIPRVLRRLETSLLFLVVAAAMFRWPMVPLSLNGHSFRLTDVVLDPVFGLGFFCLLGWALDRERQRVTWPVRWLARLGLASYSLYLIHPLVIDLAGDRLPEDGIQRLGALVGIVVICLLAAGALHWLVERHFIRRSQAIGRRPTGAAEKGAAGAPNL